MAIFRKGINGAFSGTIGNTVGSSWRQIDYMKSLPRPSKKPATQAQLLQRARFALAVGFLRPMKDLLNVGYSDKSLGKATGYNMALRQTIRAAVVGEYPELSIDFSMVEVSKGPISGLSSLVFTEAEPGQLNLSWSSIINRYTAFGDDEVIVLLYNTSKRFLSVYDGTERSALTLTMETPTDFSGDEMVAWVFLLNRDGVKTSDSQFAGPVTLS